MPQAWRWHILPYRWYKPSFKWEIIFCRWYSNFTSGTHYPKSKQSALQVAKRIVQVVLMHLSAANMEVAHTWRWHILPYRWYKPSFKWEIIFCRWYRNFTSGAHYPKSKTECFAGGKENSAGSFDALKCHKHAGAGGPYYLKGGKVFSLWERIFCRWYKNVISVTHYLKERTECFAGGKEINAGSFDALKVVHSSLWVEGLSYEWYKKPCKWYIIPYGWKACLMSGTKYLTVCTFDALKSPTNLKVACTILVVAQTSFQVVDCPTGTEILTSG